ncbi:Uncharacterised protein [Klebsiella pneumoniae]|uniref:Uncharacterized protein n=1 Tax=Klebsiella pneumoniae TaxID=573 RepID=A0A2X3CJ09_KLEPN|nr:Uncharacterised protein [Klebsiella pneumoniae]
MSAIYPYSATVTVNGGGRDLPAGRSAGVSSDSRRHPAPAGAPGPEKVAISCTSGFAIQWLLRGWLILNDAIRR